MQQNKSLQLWGGIECTINRVDDQYFDQLAYSGHYDRRASDIEQLSALGITAMRYPILWERYGAQQDTKPDFTAIAQSLHLLRDKGVTPIAGLVHHGSGPDYVSFLDGSFEQGLATYAAHVARAFPWIEYYTPVNEPLTTARFCALYGLWFPHGKDDKTFIRVLVSECKATILAMKEIRKVNPRAKLVLTEDLGKIYSTRALRYQADFENHRRWLSIDLVSGLLTPDMPMWHYLTSEGIKEDELIWFIENGIKPDILGFNHYLTSERYLDENIQHYPMHTHGGNGRHVYADVEAVRVPVNAVTGPYALLTEAWERYGMPMAITEVHLHCTREEQLRWFTEMWTAAVRLRESGVDVRAVTAWAMLGSYGWDKLLTEPNGTYEPGVFNVSDGTLRPTALAHFLKRLSKNDDLHPVVHGDGWWKDDIRLLYPKKPAIIQPRFHKKETRPLLILGKTGTLGNAFNRICHTRGLHHHLLSRQDVDITKADEIKEMIAAHNPWAIINATGFVRVDDAQHEFENCYGSNCLGPQLLAKHCAERNIQLANFSSDLVFSGAKHAPYIESDPVAPLNLYGKSKAMMEAAVLAAHDKSLMIRTSSFFGPWDAYNFINIALQHLQDGRHFTAAHDMVVSPTYVPDLVHATLDLLLDEAAGMWHLCNDGEVSWADFARRAAELAGLDANLIRPASLAELGLSKKRPHYSALKSERGLNLPSLEDALQRYMDEYNQQASRHMSEALAA